MARQQAVVDINAFVKGIITEASPLTFPDNASIDELNLVPQKDGSRKRRLGMDYEEGYAQLSTGESPESAVAYSSFQWKGPGGYTEKEFAVIQTGQQLAFLDSTQTPVSTRVFTLDTVGTSPSVKFSFASVDGLLVVAVGTGNVIVYDYNGNSLNRSTGRLKIRDLFGVADQAQGVDLITGEGLTVRPSAYTNEHIYNLRNQTFAVPRKRPSGDPNSADDPIQMFRGAYGVFPSNADNLVTFLYADANNEDDRNIRRFFYRDMFDNPLGTNRAPLGYFIIDALDRGASRLQQVQGLNARNPLLTNPVTNLPTDLTPGGATVLGSFGGRVFFAGFSSQVINGDSQSPRMTSYVLFSKLVQSQSDIFKCYQEGDPTSSETPDLVDTDGGFLRVDGAYNIRRLVNVGDSLLVVAENGVWRITGGSGYGFKATDYRVDKITEHGTVSPGSVIVVDNTVMYWSDDGIYHVNQNQYGDWVANNLTTSSIQSYYDDIGYSSKTLCEGQYDSYTRQARWLYNNDYTLEENSKELILDVGLGAFYPSELASISSGFPRPVTMVRVPPFKTVSSTSSVITLSGDNVVRSTGASVVTPASVLDSSLSELFYVTLSGIYNGDLLFTLSSYRDTGFVDFKSYNGVGVDASAYLVTGWTGMGDFQRYKQVSYLTTYCMKTETGFDSNYNPLNTSSVLVQSQWNWTNSAASNKWSPEFQVYRHKRLWIPQNNLSKYDDGELVVTTKNKLRGRGKVLSLKFSTEPGKDFHLLGWSFLGGVNGSP